MPRLAFFDLDRRDRQPELMDQPGLDDAQHRRALAGLRSINVISRSSAILWSAVRRLAAELGVRSLRVLDLACGGGDVGIGLARTARRFGLDIVLVGCDRSPLALDVARARASRVEVAAQFIELDVLHDTLPSDFDVVTCSLFLHHLEESDAERLLRHMAEAARHLLLVNDLVRSRFGYVLAWWGSRVLTRSHVVHVDGPLSVRAAFSPSEALDLAKQAGLNGAVLSRHWPQRFLLSWRRRES